MMFFLVYYLHSLIPVWFLMLQLLGIYSFLAEEQKAKKSQSDLYISKNKTFAILHRTINTKNIFSEAWLY